MIRLRPVVVLWAVVLTAGALAGLSQGTAMASTCVSWTGGPPANPSSSGDLLTSVSVQRPCDVWAVGYKQVGVITQTLTEHWNGLAWTPMPSSDPGGSSNDSNFAAVAVKPAADGWAVGHYSNGKANQTLIELLVSGTWEQVSSPNPAGPTHDNFLNAVTVTSAKNAWAVGTYIPGLVAHTLIERWNGATWSRVTAPSPKAGEFLGVAATSASNAWAVGNFADSSNAQQTLIEHWNGTSWKQVPSPDPGGPTNTSGLSAVAVSSASNAWAVGDYFAKGVVKSLILHWNGKSWKQVTAPSLDGSSAQGSLTGVTIVSATNAWAVGTDHGHLTLAAHWNGISWAKVPTPNPGSFNQFAAVGASSATNVWAVGTYVSGGPDLTFALHCC